MGSKALSIVAGIAAAAVIVTGAAVVSMRPSGKPTASAVAGTDRTPGGTDNLRAPGGTRPGHAQGQPTTSPTRPTPPSYQPHGSSGGTGDPGGPPKTRTNLRRQDRVLNGTYTTVIAGHYSGSGVAEVKDDRVSFKGHVRTADGRTGELQATNMTVLGPYFFGPGTVMGEGVQITGRVDAARASRLLANFTTADGNGARMVGRLPSSIDAGDDAWIGENPPRQGE